MVKIKDIQRLLQEVHGMDVKRDELMLALTYNCVLESVADQIVYLRNKEK